MLFTGAARYALRHTAGSVLEGDGGLFTTRGLSPLGTGAETGRTPRGADLGTLDGDGGAGFVGADVFCTAAILVGTAVTIATALVGAPRPTATRCAAARGATAAVTTTATAAAAAASRAQTPRMVARCGGDRGRGGRK